MPSHRQAQHGTRFRTLLLILGVCVAALLILLFGQQHYLQTSLIGSRTSATYSLTPSTTEYTTGDTAVISFTRPKGANISQEWVGLFKQGASNNQPIARRKPYIHKGTADTRGTVTFPIVAAYAPGVYDVRYFDGDRHITTTTITITDLPSQQTSPYAPNQIIVKFKPNTTLPQVNSQGVGEAPSMRQGTPLHSITDMARVTGTKKVFTGKPSEPSPSQPGQLLTASQKAQRRAKALQKRQEFGLDRIFVLDVQIREDTKRQLERARNAKDPLTGQKIHNIQGVLDIPTIAKRLQNDPSVEWAEPNYIMKTAQTPNDPYYSSRNSWGQGYDDLWGIKKIQSEGAWQTTRGENIVVAVIDTGVDWQHEDLAGNIWRNTGEIPNNNRDDDNNGYVDDVRGWDFTTYKYCYLTCGHPKDPDNDPDDGYGHGTHVAGTIGAIGNNTKGVIGVAPNVKIMPLKGLSDSGGGKSDWLAEAVRYAADNGAHITNNSWGGGGISRLFEEVFNYAYSLDTISVAAAGNSGRNMQFATPANIESVIAVAASTQNDHRAFFSNWGYQVDVAAPGGGYIGELGHTGNRQDAYNILSTLPDDGFIERHIGTDPKVSPNYWRLAGTSMAAPHAAAAVALIKESHPAFTPEEARNTLRYAVDSYDSTRYIGTGRINVSRAVQVTTPPPSAKIHVEGLPIYTLRGGETINVEFTRDGPISHVRGAIDIEGTAKGAAFEKYTLQWGEGASPTTWNDIGTYTTAVDDGVLLADWDTGQLKDGIYTLRLIVEDTPGQWNRDHTIIKIKNLDITSPMNNDIYRLGDTIDVTGVIGSPLQTFTVEWGEGWQPSTWSSSGITLANGGRGSIIDDTVATWDTSGIATGGFYSMKITVQRLGQTTEDRIHMMYLDPMLKEGWPQRTGKLPRQSYGGKTHIQVVDLNGDGRQEVVALRESVLLPCYLGLEPCSFGGNSPVKLLPARLTVYRADGSVWWQKDIEGERIRIYTPSPLVVGDVDNNGTQEIFILASNDRLTCKVSSGGPCRIYGYQYNGTALPGWPFSGNETVFGKYAYGMAMGDIGGSLGKEIIIRGYENSATMHRYISIDESRQWKRIVSGLPKCPASLLRDPFVMLNVDADSALEIAVSYDCSRVAVYNGDGSLAPGWPKQLDSKIQTVVAGDMNSDGFDDVVVDGTPYAYRNLRKDATYIIGHNGRVFSGWPYQYAPGQRNEWFHKAHMALFDAAAPFNNGGPMNIAVSFLKDNSQDCGQYVFNPAGSVMFSKQFNCMRSTRGFLDAVNTSGDVNGDGAPDVLLTAGGIDMDTVYRGQVPGEVAGGVWAWDASGRDIDFTSLAGKALVTENTPRGANISDIDGDGKVEVVTVSWYDWEHPDPGTELPERGRPGRSKWGRNSIYVWDLNKPYAPQAQQWPTFQHDTRLTGRYERPNSNNSQFTISVSPTSASQGDSVSITYAGPYQTLQIPRILIAPAGSSIQTGRFVRSVNSNNRTFQWTVPNDVSPGSYELRYIERTTGGGQNLKASTPFTVTQSGGNFSVSVDPNTAAAGETVQISYAGPYSTVSGPKVYLYRNNARYRFIRGINRNTHTFPWTIPGTTSPDSYRVVYEYFDGNGLRVAASAPLTVTGDAGNQYSLSVSPTTIRRRSRIHVRYQLPPRSRYHRIWLYGGNFTTGGNLVRNLSSTGGSFSYYVDKRPGQWRMQIESYNCRGQCSHATARFTVVPRNSSSTSSAGGEEEKPTIPQQPYTPAPTTPPQGEEESPMHGTPPPEPTSQPQEEPKECPNKVRWCPDGTTVGLDPAKDCKEFLPCTSPVTPEAPQEQPQPAQLACTDSDNGKTYDIQGITRDGLDTPLYSREFTDTCIVFVNETGYQNRTSCTPQDDRCSVREGYCPENADHYDIDTNLCAYGCQDGRCLPEPEENIFTKLFKALQSSVIGAFSL